MTWIFLCYFLDRIAGFEMMYLFKSPGNPLLGLVAMMLLFANVRATVLSRRWQDPATEPDVAELPERSDASFADKFANRLPALIWPKARYVFYPLSAVLLALSIFSVIVPINHQKATLQQTSPK